ncbi:YdeI/OmpD-associated family protein [Pararhodonellum marinum]|uniref:YdeI/OmpD-associated family protein n=1 Tax=Pararhodonellum marinum TaxID=2755358 RepID=UPI001890B5FB|nr:YdeI/OmpD-associated family protein [Pararhodonellum marinum]
MESFISTLENFNNRLWQFHVPVPESIALSFIEGDNRRVYVTLQDQIKIQAALMKAEPYWFILVNKKVKEKLRLNEGDKIKVVLEKDHTEFGLEMPEEFQVLLDQDEEGNDFFRALTMGKQRSLIYLVTQVKNPDSRLKKSLAILHHLKEVQGELDFKRLMATIKYFNQNY